MTITELIKELELCRDLHGDVEVKVQDSGKMFAADARADGEHFDIQDGALIL